MQLILNFFHLFCITQSKALNSNSGIEDALGDSGLLLDPDMTITNSPENASAQVHNIIYKIENKLMMRDNGNEPQQTPNYHTNHQQFMFNRFKHLNNINVTAALNRQQQNQTSSVDPNHVQITNFIKLTEKNFPRKSQTNFNDSGLPATDNSMRNMSQEYNPFADENDSFAHFQLSKSINIDPSNHTQVTANRTRAFGNDRTNFSSQNDRLYTPSNSSKPSTYNRTEQRANTTNTLALKTMHVVDTMSSNSNDENTVMFRNYDLNDEYWLNFE